MNIEKAFLEFIFFLGKKRKEMRRFYIKFYINFLGLLLV
jgi:hypothetical protein